MIITESEKDSLSRFMRRFSPLNEYARSVRNDASSDVVAAENDPFAGIAVDDLPDDLKASITKAKDAFATLQTTSKATKELADKNDKLAKDHQARADRNFELLRKHNLIKSDGTASVSGGDDGSDAMLKQIANALQQELNLAPDAALAHAKIQLAANKIIKPEMFKEIGTSLNPTFGAVSEMYAGKLLAEAMLPKNDPDGYFNVPEIETIVKTNLDMLVKGGATINIETIDNLKSMAFGQYYQKLKPEQRTEFMNRGKSSQFSSGAPAFGSPGFAGLQRMQQQQNGSAPRAANQETSEAMDKTMALMLRGTNIKPKKG